MGEFVRLCDVGPSESLLEAFAKMGFSDDCKVGLLDAGGSLRIFCEERVILSSRGNDIYDILEPYLTESQ